MIRMDKSITMIGYQGMERKKVMEKGI